MERRYELRLEQMLAQAEVSPELTEGLLTRLEEFVLPFTVALIAPEQRRHTVEYITGLLSKLAHKTSEGIAYRHDQDQYHQHPHPPLACGRLPAGHHAATRNARPTPNNHWNAAMIANVTASSAADRHAAYGQFN